MRLIPMGSGLALGAVAGIVASLAGDAPAAPPAIPMPSTTQAAAQPALSAHDLGLLHDLETGSWHARKTAEAELAARDSSDIPILQEMLAQADNPEARARLEQALATIKSNDLLGASRITLHFKDAPAEQVYAEIFRQAGSPLKPSPNNLFASLMPVKLSIDVNHQSFWTVMQELYPKTGLMLDQILPGEFRLVRADPIPDGPRATQGPIMLVATQLAVALNQQSDQPAKPANAANPMAAMRFRMPRSQFVLLISAYIEPRIKVLRISSMFRIDQATDDNGNSLINPRFAGFPGSQIPLSQPGWPQLVGQLEYPAKNPGRRIAILRGSANVEVLISSGHLEIPDVLTAQAKQFSINEKSIEFSGCKKAGDDYQVHFTTSGQADDPWSIPILQAVSKMRLVDAEGHELQFDGTSTQPLDMKGVPRPQSALVDHVINFRPVTLPGGQSTSGPAKLLWDYPDRTHDIIIPIDFHDLDMNFQGQ